MNDGEIDRAPLGRSIADSKGVKGFNENSFADRTMIQLFFIDWLAVL